MICNCSGALLLIILIYFIVFFYNNTNILDDVILDYSLWNVLKYFK